MDRRRFIQVTGAGTAALAAVARGLSAVAGPFDKKDAADHFVPADKKLKPEWVDGALRQGRADRLSRHRPGDASPCRSAASAPASFTWPATGG